MPWVIAESFTFQVVANPPSTKQPNIESTFTTTNRAADNVDRGSPSSHYYRSEISNEIIIGQIAVGIHAKKSLGIESDDRIAQNVLALPSHRQRLYGIVLLKVQAVPVNLAPAFVDANHRTAGLRYALHFYVVGNIEAADDVDGSIDDWQLAA